MEDIINAYRKHLTTTDIKNALLKHEQVQDKLESLIVNDNKQDTLLKSSLDTLRDAKLQRLQELMNEDKKLSVNEQKLLEKQAIRNFQLSQQLDKRSNKYNRFH